MHSREVDRQSRTGLIFRANFTHLSCIRVSSRNNFCQYFHYFSYCNVQLHKMCQIIWDKRCIWWSVTFLLCNNIGWNKDDWWSWAWSAEEGWHNSAAATWFLYLWFTVSAAEVCTVEFSQVHSCMPLNTVVLSSSSFLAYNSRLRSAIRRHHPPQRAVLSQIWGASGGGV